MIKAILEGDQKAFKLLVDTYQLMVVNTCHAFVHDRNEAEDIAQDVFIQVFESLGKFRFESKLSTWLYRIAVNRSINHCKSPRGRAIKVDIESWKQQEVHNRLKCHNNSYWKNRNNWNYYTGLSTDFLKINARR